MIKAYHAYHSLNVVIMCPRLSTFPPLGGLKGWR